MIYSFTVVSDSLYPKNTNTSDHTHIYNAVIEKKISHLVAALHTKCILLVVCMRRLSNMDRCYLRRSDQIYIRGSAGEK